MPINEDSQGRNRFDPTKRIRGTLSKEFTESAEAEALQKLALVANSSGIRSEEKSEDKNDNNGVKVNRFNVFHTSDEVPFTPAKSINAITQRLYARTGEKKFNISILGYKNSDIKLPIINNIVGEIPMAITSGIAHNALEKGKITGNDVIGFGLGSVAQFGIDIFTRFNTVEYNKYFENLSFSKSDVSVINKTAFVENAKFSGLKVAKEIVAPTVIRFVLNKFLPKSVTENTIYKVAVNDINVPRLVTSVTGSIIYNSYAKKVIDKAYKADSNIGDVARACAVKELKSRVAISELNIEAGYNLVTRLSNFVADKKNEKPVVAKPKISNRTVTVKKPEAKMETAKSATTSTKKVA